MGESLIEITDPGQDRYATLNLIAWWNQERLRQAKVMVVGAGALGNEALKNLALLGVGRVFIADFDIVEASNLSRSVLFRPEDAGRRKVEVAAERLREINPDVQVATFHGDVTHDLGLGVYRQADMVLGCLDNRAARLAVNRACWRVGIPWIDSAMDVLMGMVRVFVPPDSACYECTMTEQDFELMNLRYSCPLLRPEDVVQGRLLTTPTSASIIGALQVQEAVKLLHGLAVPAGQGIYFNGQTYRTSLITYLRRADCYSHETYEHIIELDMGVDDLTVGTFLKLAVQHAGAEVVLLLDQEIVRTFYCPQCGANETICRPFEQVVPSQVPCPACGANRLPDVTSRVNADLVEPTIPLAQIGIPPLHIIRAETAHKSLYFELSGDKGSVLEAWEA